MVSRGMRLDSILVVASVIVVCLISLAVAHADETCNSPYVTKLIKGQEDYVYVWALGVEGVGDGSDKLVTVDVHPKSKSYGKVIASVSVGTRGEFSDLMWEMQGELGTSHAYEIGGDYRRPPMYAIGQLGADLTFDGKPPRTVRVTVAPEMADVARSVLAGPQQLADGSCAAAAVSTQQPLQTGVTYVVALTVNGLPYTWSFTVGPFAPAPSGWESLGGVLTSTPAVSSWGATRADVFVRGSGNGLYQKTWNGTAWSGWTALGGVSTSAPAATSWGANRIDVFVRGADNQLYHRSSDGTSWSSWEPLGGVLTSAPTVASWASGRLDVFVRGADNALWHKWFVSGAWSGWESLGGVLSAGPAATSWGSNRIDVFVRGTDSGLWQRSWTGSAWSGWQSLGGVLTSGPAAASCSTGHLDVLALGTDLALYRKGNGGAWGSWTRLGGVWASGPGAACRPGTTTLDLVEQASDAGLWHLTATGT